MTPRPPPPRRAVERDGTRAAPAPARAAAWASAGEDSMPAYSYLVGQIKVHDPEKWAVYVAGVAVSLAPFGDRSEIVFRGKRVRPALCGNPTAHPHRPSPSARWPPSSSSHHFTSGDHNAARITDVLLPARARSHWLLTPRAPLSAGNSRWATCLGRWTRARHNGRDQICRRGDTVGVAQLGAVPGPPVLYTP